MRVGSAAGQPGKGLEKRKVAAESCQNVFPQKSQAGSGLGIAILIIQQWLCVAKSGIPAGLYIGMITYVAAVGGMAVQFFATAQ